MSIIYWDFDGTLVKSNHLWSGSVYKALNETVPNNVEFSQIRKCMKTGFTWHTPEEDYTQITGDKWWEFMNRHIYKSYLSLGIDEDSAKLATEKIREIIKCAENYEIYPDAVETVEKLKNLGHKNIILSNNYPDLCEVLEKINIYKYFDGFVVSAVEGYDKPRQELFEIAKGYNKNNEKMFMIGDNETADIIGGKKAGMTTVFVHNGYSSVADFCTDNLRDIVEIVENIR